MKKVDAYIEKLSGTENWDEFLLAESGLPGPRANLKLIEAVVQIGSEETFLRYLTYSSDKAPVNSKEEFLAACGAVGLGRLVKEGKKEYLSVLKVLASDSRWRTRESVAMALQMYGESNMDELLDIMLDWVKGNNTEKRAAAAALCEPKLLNNRKQVVKVLNILNSITEEIKETKGSKDEGFIPLKKAMGYCWSVAIVAAPEEGKILFERWLDSEDKDIKWIVKENLNKNRLIKMDKDWVTRCIQKFDDINMGGLHENEIGTN
ncbi:MAG: hypothetical protein K0R80_2934 [Clostridia bacterium]|jgi:hypothetical protein|nr:hypothetical protein [Clostridia bacterium]